MMSDSLMRKDFLP